MIGLPFVYTLGGLMFGAYAIAGWRDRANPRRYANGLFWGLLALSFLAGDRLGDVGNGVLVLALVAVAAPGLGRGVPATTTPGERQALAVRHGNRLFAAALIVPAVALIGALAFRHMPALIDPKQTTLVALGFGTLIALIVCMAWLRPAPIAALEEGRRLADAISWALVLPQMLSALGVVFAMAGVGEVVGGLLGRALPHGSLVAAVLAYAIGMAVFTVLMGNAFAAFPVMAAAVGVPLLIQGHGGTAAAVASLGMLCGFCGTLLTPMAANYNLVPAALLELPNRYGVIRAQAPTALLMFVANLLLLYFLAFPR
ncbi:DUF979 domain-containing protein [Sphingomonas nostoxanthinifaciens]|uniref:DUF979 domain-containing protein n=1 Tax=Sphingomonas nostoxanthinifaciens TaxID=2872652 RepID=UPI001CC1DB51|nr:DUF979 domain-containing protein [Sphingomonas nostoxanthinifaciens]UAK26382.1 DUF979 domain-containing protein [Sphingomonas nostoxanthinifaciens]